MLSPATTPSPRAATIIPAHPVWLQQRRMCSPGGGVGVTGGAGGPCRGLVNMEVALRRLSPLNPLSPQGVDARGSAAGEPGLGGARVEGRETGGPEAPADGAVLRFAARASPNATEPGHAPPGRVTLGDSPRPPGFDQSGRGTCCTTANRSHSLFAYHPHRFKCPLMQIHARFFRGGGACM